MTFVIGDVVRRVSGQGNATLGTLGIVLTVQCYDECRVQWVNGAKAVNDYTSSHVQPATDLTDEEEATLMRWRLSQ